MQVRINYSKIGSMIGSDMVREQDLVQERVQDLKKAPGIKKAQDL